MWPLPSMLSDTERERTVCPSHTHTQTHSLTETHTLSQGLKVPSDPRETLAWETRRDLYHWDREKNYKNKKERKKESLRNTDTLTVQQFLRDDVITGI